MPAYEHLLYEIDERICTITLNRPEKLNALSRSLLDELEDAFSQAKADADASVVLLKGAGRSFCAGYDLAPDDWILSQYGADFEGPVNAVIDRDDVTEILERWLRLWKFPKPIIAQVQGVCLSGAGELLGVADIVVAAENARFGHPAGRDLGIPVTLSFWPMLIGMRKTKELLFTSKLIDGTEAERIGLVNQVVPEDELEAAALDMARDVARTAEVGLRICNFVPSSAINQIEMFSAATWDPDTIDRELGWAADIGFNTMRTYLHDLCWQEDRVGFLSRLDSYLEIANRHSIRTLVTIFDDCWHEPTAGVQPAPRPGIHNSGWARSPGRAALLDRSAWGELEAYVRDLGTRFGNDPRVLAWDVYNEVTNLLLPSRSLPDDERKAAEAELATDGTVQNDAATDLMTEAFAWLRDVPVSQPLTAGIFYKNDALNERLVELSDIVSFHHYRDVESLERFVTKLREHDRPLWCTEYLNRREGCTFDTHMRVFADEQIGCWNWGLVDGKTQTKWAWSDQAGGPEPEVWFHDIFRADGSPYETAEVELIRSLRAETDRRLSD